MSGLNDYFLPYQKRWILDDSPLKIYPKSRRIGITYATSYRCNDKCLRRPGFTQWVTSRDELTAREFIVDYVAKWAKASNAVCKGLNGDNIQVVDDLHGIRAFCAEYLNGSRIISLSSTPEAFAGKGGDVLIDEGDVHRDSGKVIDMAMPCTTWGNQLEMVSALSLDGGPNTPFWRIWLDCLQNGNPMGWSPHFTSIIDAVNEGFVEKINQVTGSSYTREGWLAMMRTKCRTQEAWNTQYLIIPSTDSGALLSYDLIMSCEAAQIPDLQEGWRYAGYDVGRKKDRSVYFELVKIGDTLWQSSYEILHKTPFPVQIQFLKDKMKNPLVRRLCIDYTGMGGPVCEELQRVYGAYRVEGVTFTAPVKESLAMSLRASFEDRTIRVKSDSALREDLHKVCKVVTAAGNIRFDAESDESGHADSFWSLALAKHAAGNNDGEVRMESLFENENNGDGYHRPDNSDDLR